MIYIEWFFFIMQKKRINDFAMNGIVQLVKNGKSNLSEWCHCGFCVRRFAGISTLYSTLVSRVAMTQIFLNIIEVGVLLLHYITMIKTTILQSQPFISIMLLISKTLPKMFLFFAYIY